MQACLKPTEPRYAKRVTEMNAEQLEAIEQLPLEQRAAAYGELHDALLAELEGDDAAPRP